MINNTTQKREENNHYKHPKIKTLQCPRHIDVEVFIHISDLNCWQTMLVIEKFVVIENVCALKRRKLLHHKISGIFQRFACTF